jgi:exodeoxyribonuclease III
MKLKIIAWNVNSIRALMKKEDLNKFLDQHKPHIFCMSETKLSCPDQEFKDQFKESIKGFKYRYYSTCIVKKGYSGTAIFSKKKPINVLYGINEDKHDQEGRVITLEFDDFFLLHSYTPNSGQALQRLDYRTKEWDVAFRTYIKGLQEKKNVIVCGDLNVVNLDIDIYNTRGKSKAAGFTPQERSSFQTLLSENKLIDTFRYLYPEVKNRYSYWTYLANSRAKNNGWRIDYFLVNEEFISKVKESEIFEKQMGSDHAPIVLELKL